VQNRQCKEYKRDGYTNRRLECYKKLKRNAGTRADIGPYMFIRALSPGPHSRSSVGMMFHAKKAMMRTPGPLRIARVDEGPAVNSNRTFNGLTNVDLQSGCQFWTGGVNIG
jgi:hypothetical protein